LNRPIDSVATNWHLDTAFRSHVLRLHFRNLPLRTPGESIIL